jgi:hypothetical protein
MVLKMKCLQTFSPKVQNFLVLYCIKKGEEKKKEERAGATLWAVALIKA